MNRPTLRSTYHRVDAAGAIAIELHAPDPLPTGWRLALTCVVGLRDASGVRLARHVGTYHELEPDDGAPGHPVWAPAPLPTRWPARHANDGPVSAFVILPDGATVDVDVEPMRPAVPPGAPITSSHADLPEGAPPLVPMPRALVVRDGALVHRSLAITDGPPAARRAWHAVDALSSRLTGRPLEGGAGDPLRVVARLRAELAPEASRTTIEAGVALVEASGHAGFVRAFVTLAQWSPRGLPVTVAVDDEPRWGWRALAVDLARRWYEPDTVLRIIDLAAWRKLAQVQLHLTDDEGWRLPVDGWPELAAVGGTRGHGLALPPMLGSGAAPTGRAYTDTEIAGFVARADELAVVLVPEVDLPAHCHSALAARPDLRDPDDTSGAVSVQDFVDNVLVPGHPPSDALLDAVVATLVRLFPSSPWIHVGGDEVPHGAWSGSPVAQRFAGAHGAATTRDIEAAFHRDVVARIRAHGRAVGAWEEAATSGGLAPGDGYAVAWTSAEAGQELARRGHDVVLAPGQAYYLDMAAEHDWDAPGTTWAGTVTLDDVCAFEPGEGWTIEEQARLVGLQACLWSEHVAGPDVLDRLVFPRLDAIAERAWRGDVAGGPASLRARAAAQPTLTRRP